MNWLDEREQRAWAGYRRMQQLLDLRIARDLAADSGLSAPDYDVLSTLSEHPDDRWRASDLAGRLLWSSSRLAHHVARMETRGLVRREEVDGDGRGAFVVLTGDGRRILRAAAPLHVQSVRRAMIDLLDPAEIAALTTISTKVIAALTTAPDSG